MEIPEEKLRARAFANVNMAIGVGHVTASLDRFATWSLVALGAFLAIVLTNLKSLEPILTIEKIQTSGLLLLIAGVLCFLQKYIASGLNSISESSIRCLELAEKFSPFDRGELFRVLKEDYPWPGCIFTKRAIKKAEEGDVHYVGRICVRLGFIHAIFILAQIAILGWAFAIILLSLTT